MGKVGDCLDDFLVAGVPYLIEEQGQNNGTWECKKYSEDADPECVEQAAVEIRVLEQPSEVLEVVPGTAHHAVYEVEVFEGDDNTVYWDVLEDDQKGERYQEQRVKGPHSDGPGNSLFPQDFSASCLC